MLFTQRAESREENFNHTLDLEVTCFATNSRSCLAAVMFRLPIPGRRCSSGKEFARRRGCIIVECRLKLRILSSSDHNEPGKKPTRLSEYNVIGVSRYSLLRRDGRESTFSSTVFSMCVASEQQQKRPEKKRSRGWLAGRPANEMKISRPPTSM